MKTVALVGTLPTKIRIHMAEIGFFNEKFSYQETDNQIKDWFKSEFNAEWKPRFLCFDNNEDYVRFSLIMS